MSHETQPFVLYMCFETDQEDQVCRSLAIRPNREGVEEWKKQNRDTDSSRAKALLTPEELASDALEAEKEEFPQDPSLELSNLMTRFHETMSSYRPLVGLGMAIMPTFRSHFIYNEVFRNASRHLEMVDKDHQFETYGITQDQYPAVNTQLRRLREFDRSATVLPGAILLSLVATFDSFIADTIRIMLRRKPERVIESSRQISIKEILNMSSFDDVRSKIIEDEVEAVMRRSHHEQVGYIEQKLDIKIQAEYDEWGQFIEIFERRNPIAHGNYIINSNYIRNCNKHGYQVSEDQGGNRLSLNERYLRRSSDRLLEFGLSLMFVLWLKHFGDSSETAYQSLNGRTYELIKDGQSRVAARLLDLALFKQTPRASDRTMKTMTVNLANAYKKSKNIQKAQEVISQVDWSATTDDFQICVAAVQGDIARLVQLMPRVAQADLIKKSDFREWPVFDWAREEESVREKFLEIYGEPMIDLVDDKEGDEREGDNVLNDSDAATLH